MRRARILFAAAAATFFAPGAAHACTAVSTGVAFGAYNPKAAAADDSTGTVVVACPRLLQWGAEITLSAGRSGSYAQRRMASGANNLNYNLYLNSARTQIFGNGNSGTSNIELGLIWSTVTTTVYGRIPAGQNVAAGNYSDTMTLTISF